MTKGEQYRYMRIMYMEQIILPVYRIRIEYVCVHLVDNYKRTVHMREYDDGPPASRLAIFVCSS